LRGMSMENDRNVYDLTDKPFYIGRQKQGNTSMPACHYHNTYEIYYLLEGRRNYFIQNRTYPVVKGDIVLINIQDIHKTMDAGQSFNERILINFKKEFILRHMDPDEDIDLLECFRSKNKVVHLSIPEQAFVQSILFKMADEYKKRQKGYITYEKILLKELLLFINRRMSELSDEAIEYNSRLHEKMSEIALYLMDNYMKKLSLKQVADRFYITPCHLSRAFKKTTGFTFVEYLNSVRIKEAQKLLKESRKNVMQIAELTGFDSQTHFGRVFKSITGFSPLQYRKQSVI